MSAIASTGGIATGAEYTFKPGWKPGMYWVVKAPNIVDVFDSWSGEASRVAHGFAYVRFEVLAREPARTGPPVVILRLKYKINNLYTFDEQRSYCEVTINLTTGKMVRLKWSGFDEEGGPVEAVESLGAFEAPAAAPNLEGCPHMDRDIDEFHLVWPVLSPTGTRQEWLLADGGKLDHPGGFRQTVTKVEGGAVVRLTLNDRGTDTPYPLSFVFRDGLPWYEVVDAGGAKINEIVEQGTLSP